MGLKEKVQDHIDLQLEGKGMEAFEKYYADDVVMQENELPPTLGKDANRERENEFYAGVTDFRSAEVKGVAFGDNLAVVEWSYDFTHKDLGERNYDQVAVQRWRDGKIVHERFYYGS